MHLTNVLHRHNNYRLLKAVWRKKSELQVVDLGIPSGLKAAGVQINDAIKLVKQPELEKFELPEPYNKDIDNHITSHPDWKEKKVYLFNRRVRLTEGDLHFMSLTKTVSYRGFPYSIQRLVGKEQLPNQDILVQTCINQALFWDGTQEKLPKIVNIKKPGWNYAREYGIPQKRKVTSLLKKLSILCEFGSAKYPEALNRSKFIDSFSKVFVDRGKDTLLFEMESDVLISSNKPLKPFASPNEVKITEMEEVPSVYPIKPILDLIQSNVYTENEMFPISSNCSTRHIHTLHIPHKSIGLWFPREKLARGMGCCFSFAAAEAHKRFGSTVKELPEPICVQCVYMDTQSFGFLAYQLNTLDLSTESGIKNQVWIEGPDNLYEEWNNDTGFQNYNAEVFPKMLALYMNGLVPDNA